MDQQALISCYHCQEPVTEGHWWVDVSGESEPVCCPGCQAAVQMIQGLSLEQFYHFRESCGVEDSGIKPLNQKLLLQSLLAEAVTQHGDVGHLTVVIPDIRCAACVWLLEEGVSQQSGVQKCHVSLSDKRLHAQFDSSASAAEILNFIYRLGYRMVADTPGEIEALVKSERRRLLSRIGVAGIGMAQVMMYAFAVYFSGGEIDLAYSELMRWAALFVATPVALYSATPFYLAAIADLRRKMLGMDVPVSLAIMTAYCLSLVNTVNGVGEVYFDSVTMFTFFLLFGRYLESEAQESFLLSGNLAGQTLPRVARRRQNKIEESVPIVELAQGNLLVVLPGETIPVDGVVRSGLTSVSEVAFSGETLPVLKQNGSRVLAGSRNLESDITVEMDTAPEDFLLQQISDLHREASAHKPRFSILADRVARYFVIVVLSLAGLSYLFWSLMGNSEAMVIGLTVLVVSCPCALSLATPVAYSFAMSTLRKQGVLVRDGGFLERLATIDQLIFDKTGTLTEGELDLVGVRLEGSVALVEALNIAAALEKDSRHPVASAFAMPTPYIVEDYESDIGKGVSGSVSGKDYRLGEPGWASAGLCERPSADGHWLLLYAEGPIAWFHVEDKMRSDAAEVTRQLMASGFHTALFTGDRGSSVEELMERWQMPEVKVAMTPADKLAGVEAYQEAGHQVMMIGDGVNDAAAMGRADVSLAVSPADYFVHNAADATLLSNHLSALPRLLKFGEQVTMVIRQNVTWAIVYNMTAIPLAVAGLLAPWMAALGMSLSSLLVILNARRLHRMTG